MPMALRLEQLHDATLLAIRFDWQARTCEFAFGGAPLHREAFTVRFDGVVELVVPAAHRWGRSVSVLFVRDRGTGHYEFEMQSGDTIIVIAAAHSFESMLSARPQTGAE